MKKGIFPFVSPLLLMVMLVAAVGYVAVSAGAAPLHHGAHNIFYAKGSSHQPGGTAIAKAAAASAVANPNLTYQGGPVVDGTMNVFLIFWEPTGSASVSPNYHSLIQRYFNDVGGSALYQNNQQYRDGQGRFPSGSQLSGTFIDTTTAYPVQSVGTQNFLIDANIQSEVTHAQQVNGWTSDIHNVFFVFTAPSETVCMTTDQTGPNSACTPDIASSSVQFCGYHNFFNTNTLYAALPYAASPSFNTPTGSCDGEFNNDSKAGPNADDADMTINVVSHEQMETATDPLLNAWFDSTGFEIGDKCSFNFGPVDNKAGDTVLNSNSYLVQQEWDNAISGCSLSGTVTPQIYEITNLNSSLVMDVFGGGFNAGANVIQWTNHHGANQHWALVPDGPNFQIMNLNSGLVLDVSGGSTTVAAPVIQFTNHNGLNQQWFTIPAGASNIIANVNSLQVMDVDHGGTNPGARVLQFPFRGTSNQLWDVAAVDRFHRIVNVNSKLAMDVFGGGKNAGAKVIQFSYHNGFNQLWAFVPDGANFQVMNFNSGLVLDVSGGSKAPAAPVIQWTNHNGPNQQWQLLPSAASCFSGGVCQIRNVNSGLVLDVSGGSTTMAAPVIQFTNRNTANQQWLIMAP